MDALRFFEKLYQHVDFKGARLCIWTLPDRKSRFFESLDKAAVYAVEQAAKCEVYFNVAPVKLGLKSNERGTVADVVGIVALVADLDCGIDPKGKKTRYASHGAAVEMLTQRVGLSPSAVVISGAGLHAYWMLTEYWAFGGNDSDRHKAIVLSRRWSQTLRSIASVDGVQLDAVGDLTRVFRVPGTFNHKTAPPLPVSFMADVSPLTLFNVDDFDQYLVDEVVDSETGTSPDSVRVGAMVLTQHAAIPADWLDAALENDKRFAKTWKMQRSDMPDQSGSAYDLAIANFGIQTGWTDQDVANLMIQFRRKHGLNLAKVLRRDYMQRTLAAAKQASQREGALARLDRMIDGGADSSLSDDGRSEILETLRNSLGVPLVRFIQHGDEDPTYYLILETGVDICIGAIKAVLSQRDFRAKVAVACRHVIEIVNQQRWDRVVRLLLQIVVVEDNPSEGRQTLYAEWMLAYLSEVQVYSGDSWGVGLRKSRPFMLRRKKDGDTSARVHISASEFRLFVNHKFSEKIGRSRMTTVLRAGGCEFRRVSTRTDGGDVVNRGVWAIPQDDTSVAVQATTTPLV